LAFKLDDRGEGELVAVAIGQREVALVGAGDRHAGSGILPGLDGLAIQRGSELALKLEVLGVGELHGLQRRNAEEQIGAGELEAEVWVASGRLCDPESDDRESSGAMGSLWHPNRNL